MPRPKAEKGNSGIRRFREKNPEWQELRNKAFERSKNYKKNLRICIVCQKDLEQTRGRNARYCEKCLKNRMKEYYKNNKKKIYVRVRTWRKNNPEKLKEYQRKYYEKRFKGDDENG